MQKIAPSAPAVVKIDFVDLGRFTDLRVNNRDVQYSSTIFTLLETSPARALKPVMARRFPAHTLNLRYINIDLEGRRTSAPQGLGVAPSSMQPRLALVYVLQNPSGRVIAMGSQRLVGSPATAAQSRSAPVRIEAEMMQRWLRNLRIRQ